MPATKLNDITIRQLKATGRRVDLWDAAVRGLVLRVSQRGTKTFVVWYRTRGGESRRFMLGRYPLLALSEAREKAKEALRQVADGKDPYVESQRSAAQYNSRLFGMVVEDYIDTYAKVNTRGWRETERLLKREFVGVWARWPVQAISRLDIKKVLDQILARNKPSAARHAFAALRGLLNWAVQQGYLERSPCHGAKAPSKHISRDRVLRDSELALVWQGAQKLGWPFGSIVSLLILTAQRRNEVAGMRWAELDLPNFVWILPPQRTKSGREHLIPLSVQAVELIQGLPRVHDDLVFPGRGKNTPASGFSKWKATLDQAAGLNDWRLHDLRRTAATRMAELKIAYEVRERILNHALGGIEGVYNRHDYKAEAREALERWSTFIQQQIIPPPDRTALAVDEDRNYARLDPDAR